MIGEAAAKGGMRQRGPLTFTTKIAASIESAGPDAGPSSSSRRSPTGCRRVESCRGATRR